MFKKFPGKNLHTPPPTKAASIRGKKKKQILKINFLPRPHLPQKKKNFKKILKYKNFFIWKIEKWLFYVICITCYFNLYDFIVTYTFYYLLSIIFPAITLPSMTTRVTHTTHYVTLSHTRHHFYYMKKLSRP